MSACGCEEPADLSSGVVEEQTPWWKDIGILLPVFSGLALIAGFLSEWGGAGTLATVFFWAGLVAGGSTFAPGAITRLVGQRKLGIGLLMTISAVGAIILGYVEEAAALAFLYSIVEALEDRAMERARSGLRALLDLVPKTATIRGDNGDRQIDASAIERGDIILVRPGGRVPTDGIIREGSSSVDTSAITGESIPVHVRQGADVSAGSISLTGSLTIEATATGTDNSLTTVVHLVEQAQQERGERARIADRLARPLVPGVLILALAVAVIGSLLGDPELWITRSLVVLVAASPCALAIAVPLTVVAGVGAASRFGVVFKSGAAFEELGGIEHVAFDKTGTLTRNQPSVVDVIAAEGVCGSDVLTWAAALEQHSSHPLASAIVSAADTVASATQIEETAGHGMSGTVDGVRISVGSARWLSPGALAPDVDQLEHDGITAVVIHRHGGAVGVIGVRDELRPEASHMIDELERAGIGTTLLTGDNERTARALAHQAGISHVQAGLRPEDKARAVTDLVAQQPTVMLGDGINDAPALAAATVGVAMGAQGSDVAIESADVAFLGDDLRLFREALTHARTGRRIINQNIGLSLLIIASLMPLAVTGVLGLAAVVFVHEVGEIVVILNGLRARRAPAGVRRARTSGEGATAVREDSVDDRVDVRTDK